MGKCPNPSDGVCCCYNLLVGEPCYCGDCDRCKTPRGINNDFPPGEKETMAREGQLISTKKIARRLEAVTSWTEFQRLIRDLKADRPLTPHHKGDGKGNVAALYERYEDDREK